MDADKETGESNTLLEQLPDKIAESNSEIELKQLADKIEESDTGIKQEQLADKTDIQVMENTLSKRQRKLLARRQRWQETKQLRKAKEKEKRKLKIQRKKEAGHDLGPSRKLLKSLKMVDSSCKLKIYFDLSLAHLMTPTEFSKTFKQLHRCYSINRRASAPLQLYITGYNDATKHSMSKLSSCFNWDVNFSQQRYCEMFEKSSIIYLTSDSPDVLENLDYDKVYVIGALVDHNRLKNICYENAVKDGVGHASLPLDKYFKFKTRKVLTIDQVYSIILRLTEGKTWIDAVMDIVPKRKGVELKDNSENRTVIDESVDIEDKSCELSVNSNHIESINYDSCNKS